MPDRKAILAREKIFRQFAFVFLKTMSNQFRFLFVKFQFRLVFLKEVRDSFPAYAKGNIDFSDLGFHGVNLALRPGRSGPLFPNNE